MLLKVGRDLLPPRPRKANSKQQNVIMNTPSTAPMASITPSCSKSRSSVRSTSSTRSGPLRAIQNVFKTAASPLRSRSSRLPPPPQKITVKIQEPRPFLSPLPASAVASQPTATAAATTPTPRSSGVKNTTTKITSTAASMRSQADIPRFIIINLNYYDDVPPLDMGSPLKRRGEDAPPPPSSSSIIIDNNNSLHEA